MVAHGICRENIYSQQIKHLNKGKAKPVAPKVPTEIPLSLAETLSYQSNPRPFKNPNYVKSAAARKARPVKVMLLAEREREEREIRYHRKRRQEKAEREKDTENRMDVDEQPPDDEKNSEKNSEESEVLDDEELVFYSTLEAPPSLMPQKRFCDITGLEAPYTDPQTGLRYHDKNIYAHIRTLKPAAVQSHLNLRGGGPNIIM
ncbi:chromatin-remodeling complex subunit ies6 [Tulasnella sp. 419]|nr:chromatin-remodeling complex subunit ies6 [Tulasnella sp. 419]